MNSSSEVAASFARVSRELLTTQDGELTFERITARAVEIVPPCDAASITLRRKRGSTETVAATGDLATACDKLQYELDEGPCVDAVFDGEAYYIDDVATDERWPAWGPAAAEAGVGSVLSVRMANDDQVLGALNLYSTTKHAYDSNAVDLALVFASHAATAISNTRLVDGLQTALQSRHLIGVAQGILMAQYDMGLETAFEVLRRYSSHANVKLRDIALQVVESRSLPEDYAAVAQADGNPALDRPDPAPEPARER
ncbi:MAG TPA: GAF and ANTAR domain-containing protein [Nocardioides sp.]|nr:GAF and ANTAR domain-containing protein [Nocardioides sp.]